MGYTKFGEFMRKEKNKWAFMKKSLMVLANYIAMC